MKQKVIFLSLVSHFLCNCMWEATTAISISVKETLVFVLNNCMKRNDAPNGNKISKGNAKTTPFHTSPGPRWWSAFSFDIISIYSLIH